MKSLAKSGPEKLYALHDDPGGGYLLYKLRRRQLCKFFAWVQVRQDSFLTPVCKPCCCHRGHTDRKTVSSYIPSTHVTSWELLELSRQLYTCPAAECAEQEMCTLAGCADNCHSVTLKVPEARAYNNSCEMCTISARTWKCAARTPQSSRGM